MVQASGAWANEIFPSLAFDPTVPDKICTILHVQITVECPNGHIFDMVRRYREKGRKANFIESDTATGYFGAWASDRFIRIYEKSKELIRLETVYKKAYAMPMYSRLVDTPEGEETAVMGSWLAYEVLRLNDPMVTDIFSPFLKPNAMKPPKLIRRPETDTEWWIRKTVLPALYKYRQSHDCDEGLIEAIYEILKTDN